MSEQCEDDTAHEAEAWLYDDEREMREQIVMHICRCLIIKEPLQVAAYINALNLSMASVKLSISASNFSI